MPLEEARQVATGNVQLRLLQLSNTQAVLRCVVVLQSLPACARVNVVLSVGEEEERVPGQRGYDEVGGDEAVSVSRCCCPARARTRGRAWSPRSRRACLRLSMIGTVRRRMMNKRGRGWHKYGRTRQETGRSCLG